PGAADLLPLTAPAFDATVLDRQGRDPVAELDPEFRQARINEATARLMATALAVPAVIVVEDAHWLDTASRELLAALAGHAADRPWLIIASARPGTDPLPAGDTTTRPLTLAPLATDALVDLVGSVADLPADVRDLVVSRSGGNPLFAIELARAAAAGTGELPGSIESLITARIDRLGHGPRALVRAAAVLGATFDLRLLATTIGRDPKEELADLDDLVTVDRDHTGAFRSEVIARVAYEGLPGHRRSELHGAVAAALEADRADIAVLAHHHGRAGNHARAWTCHTGAAERDEALGLVGPAADHLAAAIEAATAATPPIVRDAELTDALAKRFRLEVAAKRYQDALAVGESALGRLEDRLARSRLLVRLSRTGAEVTGDYRRWIERLEDERAGLGTGQPDAEARALLAATIASLQYRLDDPDRALATAETALIDAELAGSSEPVTVALQVRQLVLAGRADPGRFAVGEELIRVATEIDDRATLISAHNNLGLDLHEDGRWDEAIGHYRAAIELAERIGDHNLGTLPAINRAAILIDRGRWDEARTELDELRRGAVHHRSGFDAAFVQAEYGRLEVHAGRAGAGRPALVEALAWFEEAGVQSNRYEVGLTLATADLADGRSAEALAVLDGVVTPKDLVAQQLGRRATLRGLALMQRGDHEAALEVLTAAVAEAEGRNRFGHGWALAAKADAEEFLRRGRSARRTRAEATGILDDLGVVELPIIPLPK
ncbi:MAG: tetratricopeptide repeat protein, partial [Actinomycetota bacterium]